MPVQYMYIIKTKTLKQFYMGRAHIYLLFICVFIYFNVHFYCYYFRYNIQNI